jgi:hypothetical protein
LVSTAAGDVIKAGGFGVAPLTRGFRLERVTRIELALSAWEVDRSRLPAALTWQSGRSYVTVAAPS